MDVLAIALGLVVGLSLGALGGGGSTLAVPVLVFVAGLRVQDATTASLLVVGVAAAFGAADHFRHGNVRLGVGLAFGASGVVGSRVGTLLNQSIEESVLLLAFSALIAYVAVRLYRSVDVVDQSPSGHSAEPNDGGSGSLAVATRARVKVPSSKLAMSPRSVAKLAGAATAVGLLTGLFGVGGGFAVVPALTLLLGFPVEQAIGTSLVVIVINAALALTMRTSDLGFDWGIVAPFLATVTIGVLIGTRVARRIDADRLTRSFAIMLGVVAGYTAASTLLGA